MAFFPMLKSLMDSLFRKNVTLAYPRGPMKLHERSRGHIRIDIDACIYCGLCQRKCPTGAILVDRSVRSWRIARFDCMQCGACVEVCPKKCLYMENTPAAAMLKQEWHVEQIQQAEPGSAPVPDHA